ncbi:MAG: hypothetical protein AAF218_03045 [Pseudomonadota bacterium]
MAGGGNTSDIVVRSLVAALTPNLWCGTRLTLAGSSSFAAGAVAGAAALGVTLFVMSGVYDGSILKMAYHAGPFVLFMLMVTLMTAYIPSSSTSLSADLTDRTANT